MCTYASRTNIIIAKCGMCDRRCYAGWPFGRATQNSLYQAERQAGKSLWCCLWSTVNFIKSIEVAQNQQRQMCIRMSLLLLLSGQTHNFRDCEIKFLLSVNCLSQNTHVFFLFSLLSGIALLFVSRKQKTKEFTHKFNIHTNSPRIRLNACSVFSMLIEDIIECCAECGLLF